MTGTIDDSGYDKHEEVENLFARDEAIAKDVTTPPHVLDAIARKPVDDAWANDRAIKNIGWAREFVASHPRTDPETLRWLSTVPNDAAVLASVLKHPSTPQSTLRLFIGSDDEAHWSLLTSNPAVDDAFMLDLLAAHPGVNTLAMHALQSPRISDVTFEGIASGLGAPWAVLIASVRQSRAERNDF
jgi:hypothetical protein